MTGRKWFLAPLALVMAISIFSGCARSEARPTPSPQVIVVTATADPEPSLTPRTITIVVTATPPPASATPEIGPETESVPTVEASVTAEPTTEVTATAEESGISGAAPEGVEASLVAQEGQVQYSPRPDSFVEPTSLEELASPANWSDLRPDEPVPFRSFDGVRVAGEGQALLDLGRLARVTLMRDAELQSVSWSLIKKELNEIGIDIGASPLLGQISLAAQLIRGGVLGEIMAGGEPVALTTPDAAIIVQSATFFLAYDPENEITWVGNFGGTVDVGDANSAESESLPDGQLTAVPAVNSRKYWPLHEHMTPEEYGHLIEQLQSPIAAADMISGPYLIGEYEPEVAARGGPGTEFNVVGSLVKGEYVRVIGKGRGWWQIACPSKMLARGTDCWVAGGQGLTSVYNVEDVPITALPASATPTATATSPPPTLTETPLAP